MKILVLGNGFDLDHNLPTSYVDFLHFCNCALEIDNSDSVYLGRLKTSQLTYIEKLKEDEKIKDTFLGFIKNNHLLTYYNERYEKLGKDWIDFERELKEVVSAFRTIEIAYKKSDSFSYVINTNHKIHQILESMGIGGVSTTEWTESRLVDLHDELCHSFNKFSCALEYYISTFVNTTPVMGVSPDVIDFDANRVITFNYSNTYERNYGGVRWDEKVDYVHGKASNKIDESTHIILGITSSEQSVQGCYVEFEKYFQRITKKTGNDYKNWLQSRLGKNEKIEVAFFGHSLDASDSDVIKDLICATNTLVRIYYHDEIAHQKIVANLIELVGKESLIEYVSGENPKIKIIEQRQHENESTAGVEITRDIRKLYRLHLLSTNEIEILLSKINKKVNTKDLSYFYTQKKAIGLFEALQYHEIDFALIKDFFNICNLLDYEKNKFGKVKYIDEEEWYGHEPWGDEISCDKNTSSLINRINRNNDERYWKEESKKMYSKFLEMKTSEEIKTALIELLSEEHPTKEYWKQLDELIRAMTNSKLLEETFKLIKKEECSLAVNSKLKHFIREYEEHCFNVDYQRQMAENYSADDDY